MALNTVSIFGILARGVGPANKPKTAFITRYGLFQFRALSCMSLLCNAPATIERLMGTAVENLPYIFGWHHIWKNL